MRSYDELDNGNSPQETPAVLLGDKCQTKCRFCLGKSLKTQKCHWPLLMKNHVCCGSRVRSDSGSKFSQRSRVCSQLADSQGLGYTVGISGPSTNGTWMDTCLPQRSSWSTSHWGGETWEQLCQSYSSGGSLMEKAKRNKEVTREEGPEGWLLVGSHLGKRMISLFSKVFWLQSEFKNSYDLKFLCFPILSFINEHIINMFLDQKKREK